MATQFSRFLTFTLRRHSVLLRAFRIRVLSQSNVLRRLLISTSTLTSTTLISALTLWKTSAPMDSATQQVLDRADALYKEYLISDLYDLLLKEKNEKCAEIMWRLARATCEKAKLIEGRTEERKKLMYEAFAYIQTAHAAPEGDNNFAVHKWYAILINYTNEYEGTKQTIVRALDVKGHLERAVDINPLDATTWHILGQWHFSVADLPWYQRKIATAIFATPPTSTYEDALRNFMKAETVDPGFYSQNELMIAKTHLKLGDKTLAKQYLQMARDHVVVSADDQAAHEEAVKLLKDL